MNRNEELKNHAQSWAEAAMSLQQAKDKSDAAERALGKAVIILETIEKELSKCVSAHIPRKVFTVEGDKVVVVDYRKEYANRVSLEEVL